MAMKLMKKAVPHTMAGIRKAPMNICFIHLLPVRRKHFNILVEDRMQFIWALTFYLQQALQKVFSSSLPPLPKKVKETSTC